MFTDFMAELERGLIVERTKGRTTGSAAAQGEIRSQPETLRRSG